MICASTTQLLYLVQVILLVYCTRSNHMFPQSANYINNWTRSNHLFPLSANYIFQTGAKLTRAI